MARQYYDSSIPSGYHLDEHYLRIGDTQFFVPPTSVKVHRQTKNSRVPMLRARNSMVKESGYYDWIVEMTLFFPDAYSINNELRPLLAQTKKCPFLPIANTYLNEIHGIDAVTISGITVQTTPGFPETLQAVLQCYVFDPSSYIFGAEGDTFDELFDWELFRWYYQRSLLPPPPGEEEEQERSQFYTYFEPLKQELNDNFLFRVADEMQLRKMQEWRKEKIDFYKRVKKDYKHKGWFDAEDWFVTVEDLRPKNYDDLSPERQEEIDKMIEEELGFFNDFELHHRNEEKEDFYKKFADKLHDLEVMEYDLHYEPWRVPNLHLVDFSVGFENSITSQQIQMDAMPTHQYMGSQDTMLVARFHASDAEAVGSLEELIKRGTFLVREYHKDVANGFLQFDHQLARLYGVTNVTVEDMSVTTMDGQPGMYEVSLTMMGYNRAERKLHEVKMMSAIRNVENIGKDKDGEDDNEVEWTIDKYFGNNLKPFWNPEGFNTLGWLHDRPFSQEFWSALDTVGNGIKQNDHTEKVAVYDAAIMETFKAVELYPDLELPTYTEVHNAGFQIPRLSEGMFVDPDFFIRYDRAVDLASLLDQVIQEKAPAMHVQDAVGGRGVIDGLDEKVNMQAEAQKEMAKASSNRKRVVAKDPGEVEKNLENLDPEEMEALLRKSSLDEGLPESYLAAFVKSFDPHMKHFYEEGSNTDLGGVYANESGIAIRQNDQLKFNKDKGHIGVMRVDPAHSMRAGALKDNIAHNVKVGARLLSHSYREVGETVMDGAAYNQDYLYSMFGMNKTVKNEKRLQFVIASLYYMGYRKEVNTFMQRGAGGLPSEALTIARNLADSLSKENEEWEDERINKKLEGLPVSDYEPPTYEEYQSVSEIEGYSTEDYGTKFLGGKENPDAVNRSMLYDMLKHDKRGRLVRAFPTYFLSLIDEGQFVGVVKLSDQFFNYQAVTDITYNNSRKQASSTLMLEMSNIYGSLSDAHKAMDLSYTSFGELLQYMWFPGHFAADAERSRHRDQAYYKSIYLRTGTRVHFRMGYGSSPLDMPTMMNGSITSIRNNGETLSVLAQDDGIELVNKLNAKYKPDEETLTWTWGKKEPSEILDELLTDSHGLFDNIWTAISNGAYYDHSLGIHHFGFPGPPEGSENWKGIFDFRERSEINMNIHRTTGYTNADQDKWYRQLADAFGIGQSDEDNISINLYDKTVWDVLNISAHIGPDMITAVHPFGFRNTIFLGKPQFPIHFDYTVDLLSEKVTGTKVKAFKQMHVYDSVMSIIGNTIEATERNMYTVAVGSYLSDGKLETTPPVYVDTNIWPEKQKVANVDTTLNAKGFRVLDNVVNEVGSFGVTELLNKPAKWFFDEGVALKITASALRDYVKDMYDGYLTVMGDPSVKPYDGMIIQDAYHEMAGPADVKEVVQIMNQKEGYITMIKPDVVCYNTDREIIRGMFAVGNMANAAVTTLVMMGILNKTRFRGKLPITNALWAATKAIHKGMWAPFKHGKELYNKVRDKFTTRKGPPTPGSTPRVEADTRSSTRSETVETPERDKPANSTSRNQYDRWDRSGLLDKVIDALDGGSKADIEDLLTRGIKNGYDNKKFNMHKMDTERLRKLNEKATDILFKHRGKVGGALKGVRHARAGAMAAKGFIVGAHAAAGPPGIIALAIEATIVEILAATVGEWIERKLLNRQAVIIVPLKKDGVRLLAGVNGHKGSVAGDAPDFWQRVVGGISLGVPFSDARVNLLSLFLGIDTSKYAAVDYPDFSAQDLKPYDSKDYEVRMKAEENESVNMDQITPENIIGGFFQTKRAERPIDPQIMKLYVTDLKAANEDFVDRIKKQERIDNIEQYTGDNIIEKVERREEGSMTAAEKENSSLDEFDLFEDLSNWFEESVVEKIKEAFDKIGDLAEDIGDFVGLDGSFGLDGGGDGTADGDSVPPNGKAVGLSSHFDKIGPMIEKEAQAQGIPQWAELLKAKTMQESSGNYKTHPDVMQASESAGYPGPGYLNTEESIKQGVSEFKRVLNKANGNVKLALQSYNFGPGFIDYVQERGGEVTQELIDNFSDTWAKKMGWERYGDKNYLKNVLRYYKAPCSSYATNGGGSASAPNPGKKSTYAVSSVSDAKAAGMIDVQTQPDRNFNVTLVGSRSTSLLRPGSYQVLRDTARRYKKKTNRKFTVTSCFRKNNTSSWHGTGYAVDIDTPNTMKTLKNGKLGFPPGRDRQHAWSLMEAAAEAGWGKFVFGDWFLLQKAKEKYGVDIVYRPSDHHNHLHLSYPEKKINTPELKSL